MITACDRRSRSSLPCRSSIPAYRVRRLDDAVCWTDHESAFQVFLRSFGSLSWRAMAPCLCAPTIHKGSFRCRQHRVAARNVASDGDSWSTTVSQTSATVPCLCAPTSHPGSFRCHLHRSREASWGGRPLRPSAHAKSLRNAELPPVKAGDHSFGLKKAAFARMHRAPLESKLRCELNKAMPEIVAAVEDLRISPVKIVSKKSKLLVAPVPRAGMVTRASNNINQENTVQSDAVSAKGSAEAINTVRPQNKVPKRPTSFKDRRLRAKSDVLMGMKL